MLKLLAVPAALVALAPLAAMQQRSDETLTVSALRFYSAASATTTIEGVCEVRLGDLLAGLQQSARYRVEITVLDSAGLELQRSDWNREVPAAALRTAGATALESFSFAAAPGQYRIRVRATPERGVPVEKEIAVRAFSVRPALSDLLLAAGVRRSATDADALAPGEIRRAGMAMRTAPMPRVSPTEPSLSYYAEMYPWTGAAMTGELRVLVMATDGRVLVQTPPRALEVSAQGGISRGSLDLTGLPEGEYRFALRLRLGDSTLSTDAPFVMGSLATALAAAVEPVAADLRAEERLVANADEARLDSLYAPLIHILEPNERGVYGNLTVDGKRRFLEQFWRRRDPTPLTPDNLRLDEYYRAVAYANETFREGGAAGVSGWRTDRGRIYLKYGRPDETLRRPTASPRPYEVWKYTRERQRNYVFYDQSGLGSYYLMATNDRSEQGTRSWDQLVRQPGSAFNTNEIREMFYFLGLPLTSVETSP